MKSKPWDSRPNEFSRSPDIDMDIARDEIARAHRLAPEVVPAHPPQSALSYVVGIRPSRDGGFRLEAEVKGSRTVISAYGFGGSGYAFSYGIADEIKKMVEKVEFENVVHPLTGARVVRL